MPGLTSIGRDGTTFVVDCREHPDLRLEATSFEEADELARVHELAEHDVKDASDADFAELDAISAKDPWARPYGTASDERSST